MRRYRWSRMIAALAAIGFCGAACAADAGRKDFEVTGPDGRRILLKSDGRWQYVEPERAAAAAAKKPVQKPADAKAADGEDAAGEEKPQAEKDKLAAEKEKKDQGEAVLTLERKVDGSRSCTFALRLMNNLPYEVRSLIPEFRAYRTSDTVYDAVFGAFQFIRPGDSQRREIRFQGIGCPDIVRLQVAGGDRCEMGDLDRFSRSRGACLSHIRVVESELIRFDK